MVHHYKLSLTSIASVFLVISFFAASAFAQSQNARPTIEYHFPMDGSKYVPGNTPIILRPTTPIALSVATNTLVVTGTMTGLHDGNLVLSDDGRTMIFTATDPFESGERVSVNMGTGNSSTNSSTLAPVSFSFEVQDNEQPDKSPFLDYSPTNLATPAFAVNHSPIHGGPPVHTLSHDTVNLGFDSMAVTIDSNPAPGYLFLAAFSLAAFGKDTGSTGAYRMVLDKNGDTVYFRHALDSIDWDFQPQPNGLMTFFSMKRNKWFAMDSNYNIVDSFATTAPYTADLHDFEILTHNHALMLSYYPIKPYDLSKYGGSDTATFIGGVIEEIDSFKNPVWIWRSWDPGHYLDTDATYDLVTEKPFDAVHPNAVSVDTDGNILLSARELDEVSKISRKDGSFIWRLGGKHNQFKFINDSIHFSHQHGARRIANGHITLFDNGNENHTGIRIDVQITPADTEIFPNPPLPPDTMITPADTSIDTSAIVSFARACEYNVDTTNMTATLVWFYTHNNDSLTASQAMGYVQRLPDSNTLITWGINPAEAASGAHLPAVTEVTPDKHITFELGITGGFDIYRAFKFPSPKYDPGFVAPASPDTLLPSSVAMESPIPNSPVLGSPFPNPSNGSSMVTISAAPSDRLTLDLYDPLGREVQTYFSGIATSPSFSLQLLTGDLPNGAYELVLRGEGGTVSRQFNILR